MHIVIKFKLVKITDFKIIKVRIAISGAANENIIKCLRTRIRSRPSCIKKETKPNAAGALCNMIAMKTIISTSVLDVAAAAPNAIPSAYSNILIIFTLFNLKIHSIYQQHELLNRE